MSSPNSRQHSKRLDKKTLLFQILQQEPDLSAQQLKERATRIGISISLVGAYRTLSAFRESDGALENSETRYSRLVASILKEAPPGVHLTVPQIQAAAAEQNVRLHKATAYRVLSRLLSIGLVLKIQKRSQHFYEWKRDDDHHGHVTCVRCGKTIEFSQDEFQALAIEVCQGLGYEYSNMEFTVHATCRQCPEDPED